MTEQLSKALVQWKTKTTERQKLQSTYMAIAIISLIVAGLVGLIDNELGIDIAYVTVFSAVAFLLNAVIWHLIIENITDRIKTPRKRS